MGRRCEGSGLGNHQQSHFVTQRRMNTSNTIASHTTSAQAYRGTSQWCRKVHHEIGEHHQEDAEPGRCQETEGCTRNTGTNNESDPRARPLDAACTSNSSASGTAAPCSGREGLNSISCTADGLDPFSSLDSTRTSSATFPG